MDDALREIERLAVTGDEAAQQRLAIMRSRISIFGDLEILNQEFLSTISKYRDTLIAVMQRLIACHPIFGFTFDVDYYRNDISNIELCASFTDCLDVDWWSNWSVSLHGYESEFDTQCVPEYIGAYGQPDDIVRQKFDELITDSGKSGGYLWDAIVELRKFGKLLTEIPIDVIIDTLGKTWSLSAEGFSTDELAYRAVSNGKTLQQQYDAELAFELSKKTQEQRQQTALSQVLERLSDADKLLLRQYRNHI